jgi:hypothetical protein
MILFSGIFSKMWDFWICAPYSRLFHKKLELRVTSLSDTPRLQYYDFQTLEYRYISKCLVGVALTKYMPPPFRESISWIISLFKFWTATIFLHAHLQVVYYNCVKFHKTPKSRLGGVALTRYTTPLFVKVQVELSPLLNFRQQRYSFMHICRLCTKTV